MSWWFRYTDTMNDDYKPNKVSKRNVEFMAALNRLRENNDFKIVLEKINALCHHGKDISGDNVSFSEYKCVREFNNSDHILDQVMDEDKNVYDYVKSMEE